MQANTAIPQPTGGGGGSGIPTSNAHENRNDLAGATHSSNLRKSLSIGDPLAQVDEESYDLCAITISKSTPEPIPIDGGAELLRFLQSGTLKGIENAKLRERFIRSITLPRVGKMVRLSFYFILVSNFPECVRFDEEDIMCATLKQRLSKNYVKLFSDLPQPKDEIVNLIIFCVGYTCHLLFYKLFQKQREMFDLRFVFNCYHILIFEFNGIFVSDFFVRMNIDKIFVQHKFLDYERVNKKNMLLQQQAKNKIKTKTFFGFPLAFPETHTSQDAFSFNKSLQDKFKPPKKNLHILEDSATEQASSQEKQVKIRQELRNNRRKQIEESELSKMQLFTQQVITAGVATASSSAAAAAINLSSKSGGEVIPEQLQQLLQQSQLQQQQIAEQLMDQSGIAHPTTSRSQHQPSQHHGNQVAGSQSHQQQMAIKQAMEKAEAIFAKTEVRYEDGIGGGHHSTKEDANYFANLQLNCNQISPTISQLLSYDNRTLPYAKKKMIRHAFETVNDKEDYLLQQLKQFSQSRKQKKETKLTQKVNKSIIDHFGLRPPPREYYQKHPKLDKMFKDMLDINYVLKQNTESMLQLPSSLQMQGEQANEWQQQIVDQENNYNKQNQRQKIQDSLSEVVLKNQLYHLEKRPGYRKKYIYTKPAQFIKQEHAGGGAKAVAAAAAAKVIGGGTATAVVTGGGVNTATTNSKANELAGIQTEAQAMLKLLSLPMNVGETSAIDEVLRMNNPSTVGGALLSSPMKMTSGAANTFSLPVLPNGSSSLGVTSGFGEKKKGGIGSSLGGGGGNANIMENPNPHRNIEFKVYEKESKNNGRGYYEEESETMEQRILKNKQNSDFYNDKRRQYKDKYKGFINNMSTDNNIDDILQNILHKRNQFNRNLRSKIKNL